MLPTVLGLGVATTRQIAQKMAEGGFEDWAKWQNCTDDELKEDAIAAQRISGFPMALLRTDFERMVRILESSDEVTVPSWFPALLTLHVIKHCRFCRFGERYYLFAAYKGRYAFIPLDDDSHGQPFTAGVSQGSLRTLAEVLRIPRNAGKKKSQLAIVAMGTLAAVHPEWLPRPEDLRTRSEILVRAPGFEMAAPDPTNDVSSIPASSSNSLRLWIQKRGAWQRMPLFLERTH